MKARMFLSAVALSAGFATATMAEITGTVVLDGKPPVLQPINVGAMPQCAKNHPGGTIVNEQVVVGAKGELANVIVSIKKQEGVALPPPKNAAAPASLDQVDCQYVPHVVAVGPDQPLMVKSSDAFLHNVHTQPEQNDPKNFAMVMKDPKGKKIPTDKPEYYKVKCDVHPWMAAWVGCIDNPYFAVTDKDGKFTLPDGLADGDYTLTAWHEKYDKQEVGFKVTGGKAEIKVTYKAAGADATKELQNLMPAGVKLAVTSEEACCTGPNLKAAAMAKAAAAPK